tara:strand:+ start:531 stop:809 length:279 start_codon:yes stop_codon:yes gene_type:complete
MKERPRKNITITKKLTSEQVISEIVKQYAKSGRAIFGIELAEPLGVSRAYVDAYIDYHRLDVLTLMKVNPNTSSKRARKSKAYIPVPAEIKI